MSDPLLAFRPEFPILERTTYLVSNSLGAMPRGVPDRLAEYVDEWAEQGVRAWGRAWWELPARLGDEIAPLIGADPGQVVMAGNVTLGQATVLSALDYPPQRNRIVMTALDFPSVRYVYDRLATRLGAEIVVVPAAADGIGVDADAVIAAIDERTRLVCISHVLFRSAFVMDVAPIVRRAHEMGALVSLDAFHSVGVMPVDVKALGVDFLTAGVLKWLCGGPGGCFLYVAPGAPSALEPSLTGWQAHAHPFAFEPEMAYTPGIYRWLNGTPSVPALYAAIEGPRIVKRAGVEAIRAKSMRQTARLIELADARGHPVNTPRDPARRGGTVAFDVPHAYEVSEYLLSRDVLVDYRPNAGIRVAPHFYTSDDELDAVVAMLDEALSTGRWREFAPRGGAAT
ncbi:MAG: aminotransferase class V-fold PLP-dependent enzyme [Gemmatimonadota bacterium]|nr:aminotransferase class V-fold PLP-dependent enzyme [Gemmatimonadota bacterium]MDE3171767.1 aminotransferase class V-fold PLP-dependent enzyme [Gemmatimonadota bacterium]MDE3216095.1 aminotransferase class V-fold PLP-dependent enzyme [Gemmatimonadota bacterium]